MSDKNKLHYYFAIKLTSSYEKCDIHQVTATNRNIIITNEILVLDELAGGSSTLLSSSTLTDFESRNQDSDNLN
ncbi:unnamed protein product [Rotaria sordida]|uniref:Uncharacterized protein n=1 Tax=Rotaria sordida TaxID=392033 RepID=A0A815E9G5_9BILA|nr:unnamed protein product [Rotaria sordida]CAF1269485.1 unnamed protein product [Rotaria sordida]CAF1311913.1 unnamed protein product [Rotaria sordida]CAF3788012.1 unnamed protein product [Rotaria sordida]CAF3860081.1 unnamed protein product [Rotaria sordida]